MKKVKVFQVDAFTRNAFGGNPAGVVPYAGGLTDQEIQNIAREMNCSETAFISESENPNADFCIRFFTPSQEVDLCGHATIAACHVLFHQGRITTCHGETIINQETKAGVLPLHIHCDENNAILSIVMGQRLPVVLGTDCDRKTVAELMGLVESDLELMGLVESDLELKGRCESDLQDKRLPLQIISTGLPDLMVPIKNLAALKAASPNFEKMAEYQRKHDFISIHAFTFETENPENDLSVRDFAPSVKIDEEAATGTANGALGAYLVMNKALPLVKSPIMIKIEQGIGMGRPSQIMAEICHEEGNVTMVRVGGTAVIVMEGYISF